MNKIRRLSMRIAFICIFLAVVFWCISLFGSVNTSLHANLAVYLITSAVFFASPYMIIAERKKEDPPKGKMDYLLDFGASGFYAAVLILTIYMALPYMNSRELRTVSSTIENYGQAVLALSLLTSLLVHAFSAFKNALGFFSSAMKSG